MTESDLPDDTLLDLISRARAGDQNAMALISATKRSADDGGDRAKRHLTRILALIDAHPARPRRTSEPSFDRFGTESGAPAAATSAVGNEGDGPFASGWTEYQYRTSRARFFQSNDCEPYFNISGRDSFYPETLDVERIVVPAPNDRTQIERAGLHGYRNETFGAEAGRAGPPMAREALRACSGLSHASGFALLRKLSAIPPMAEGVAIVLVAFGPKLHHSFLRDLIRRSGSIGGRMLREGILGRLSTTTCRRPSDWPLLRAGHLLGKAERLQRVIRGAPIALVSELAASELEPDMHASTRAMAHADSEGRLSA